MLEFQKPLVLLVGNATVLQKELQKTSRRKNVIYATVPGPVEAVAFLLKKKTSMVIASRALPMMNGVELLLFINLFRPRTLCVLANLKQEVESVGEAVDGKLEEQASWIAPRFRIQNQVCKAALAMAQATDNRDQYTKSHSQRVSTIAEHIGQKMNLGEDQLADIRIGSLLHDIGKIGVAGELFSNPGEMNAEQKREIQGHPGLGASLVKALGFSQTISEIIAQHHENHDGSGYPAGRAGNQISLPARVIRVADAYEAMSAHRSFRPAREPSWIQEELSRCRGLDFDPEITDVLLKELKSGRLDEIR